MRNAQSLNPIPPSAIGENTQTIRFPAPVPYYAQIADQAHMADYLDHEKPLTQDPDWRQFGAPNPAEYAHWALRACGIAAIKSAIEAFGGPCLSLYTWIRRALAIDGYLVQIDAAGQPREIGWKHQALAALCQQAGLPAVPQEASMDDIAQAIRRGQLVIASVSYEIGTTGPITRRGGHLVTVTGIILRDGQIEAVIVHNPSGRGASLQQHAVIPRQRFLEAFSGRVIQIGPRSTQESQ